MEKTEPKKAYMLDDIRYYFRGKKVTMEEFRDFYKNHMSLSEEQFEKTFDVVPCDCGFRHCEGYFLSVKDHVPLPEREMVTT